MIMIMRMMLLTLSMILLPWVPVSQAAATTHFIVMTKMGFIPKQFTASQGETIQLVVNNKDHLVRNLTIPDLRVKTPFLMEGEMASIQFEAKEKGIYDFYSYSPGVNQPQLKGQINIK